jgi:hypothetical protein
VRGIFRIAEAPPHPNPLPTSGARELTSAAVAIEPNLTRF